MKDMQDFLMEKAHGSIKVKPDEQRLCLETFQERILVKLTIDEANDERVIERFPAIAQQLSQDYHPLFVKISPTITNKAQMAYLKMAQQLHCPGTIVSADCKHSPYGLVLHTDHPVDIPDTSLTAFLDLNKPKANCEKKEASSFWSQLFHRH